MSARDIIEIVMGLQKANHDYGAQFTGSTVHTMDIFQFVRATIQAIREPSDHAYPVFTHDHKI